MPRFTKVALRLHLKSHRCMTLPGLSDPQTKRSLLQSHRSLNNKEQPSSRLKAWSFRLQVPSSELGRRSFELSDASSGLGVRSLGLGKPSHEL